VHILLEKSHQGLNQVQPLQLPPPCK
jgi:hypothetical protein